MYFASEEAVTRGYKKSRTSVKAPKNTMVTCSPEVMYEYVKTQSATNKTNSKRTNGKGTHFEDGIRPIDFVLVYESTSDDAINRQRELFQQELKFEGMDIEIDRSHENHSKLCFVKLHATWKLLSESAENLQMRLPVVQAQDIQETELSSQNSHTSWELCFLCKPSPGEIGTTNQRTKIQITAPFEQWHLEQFLVGNGQNLKDFFTPCQRIRIVWDTLQRISVKDVLNSPSASDSVNMAADSQRNIQDPPSFARNRTRLGIKRKENVSVNLEERNFKKRRGVGWLMASKIYIAAFPLHDGDINIDGNKRNAQNDTNLSENASERKVLFRVWANFRQIFKQQPLDLVQRYFGENISFYFAWLGFYTQMLLLPSLVGLVCFGISIFKAKKSQIAQEICNSQRDPGNRTMCPVCAPPNCELWTLSDGCGNVQWSVVFENSFTVFMAVFTVLWASIFQELWKRKEAELASRWDALEPEKGEEEIRPEFEARTRHVRINPVTKREEPYLPRYNRVLWVAGSMSALLFLIMCVVTALLGLVVVRIALYGLLKTMGGIFERQRTDIASWASNGLTFAVVITLGWFYGKAAHKLTELECPRTQEEYLTSYIWKVFIFELLNNFIPIFYVAFLKGKAVTTPNQQNYILEMCDPGGCMNEVVATVAILLLFRLVVSNAAELGMPFLRNLFKKWKRRNRVASADARRQMSSVNSRWFKDYQLNEPDLDGVYAEYMEMMVQFGFVTLFTPVFPLIPLICLLNNLVEIRLDAINFVTAYRRPIPVRVPGIRIWGRCMSIITKVAVLCNAGLIAFTSDLIPQWVYIWSYSADSSENGYVAFRLSNFTLDNKTWKDLHFLPTTNYNSCYYNGFQQPKYPYEKTLVWWQVLAFRLMFFLFFVISFYFFQWITDFLIPDVPERVQIFNERAKYLAKKALQQKPRSRAISRALEGLGGTFPGSLKMGENHQHSNVSQTNAKSTTEPEGFVSRLESCSQNPGLGNSMLEDQKVSNVRNISKKSG